MQGASSRSLVAANRRLESLLTAEVVGSRAGERALEIAQQFFNFSDTLSESSRLRNFLTDPKNDKEAKRALLSEVLGGTTERRVAILIGQLADSSWESPEDLCQAVEALGVQCYFSVHTVKRVGEMVQSQLQQLSDAVAANPEALEFLTNPKYPLEQRQSVVISLLEAKHADPVTIAIAKRCVAHPSASGIFTGAEQAISELEACNKLTFADVTSAVELTAEQVTRLEKLLRGKFGKEISAFVNVDPLLLGGLRIVVDNHVIDDTVTARLAKASRHLMQDGKQLAHV
jgi:F-type H+-transporting ATPase subunit delta